MSADEPQTPSVIKPVPLSRDPRIDTAAKALAWSELTDTGRLACRWEFDFSEEERRAYRARAIIVVEAFNAA